MPAYVTVQLEITDPAIFAEYRKVGGEAVSRHGGRALSAGRAEMLHDAGTGAMPSVLLEFPDAAAARAWIEDPDLAEVHALRNRGARATVTLLDGAG